MGGIDLYEANGFLLFSRYLLRQFWQSQIEIELLREFVFWLQENSENLLEVDQSDKKSERSETVDLNDNILQVDISDALSEREKVKFTIHTKVSIQPLLPIKCSFTDLLCTDISAGVCKSRFLGRPSAWRVHLVARQIWRKRVLRWIHCNFWNILC